MPKPKSAIAIRHFCSHLQQIPPSENDSIIRLYQWSLRYTDTKGESPFSNHPLSLTALQQLKADFPVSIQYLMVNERAREAWARYWCQLMKNTIADETEALSIERFQHVSLTYLSQQSNVYQKFMQRAEAIKKMQYRKAQQGNT